MKRTILICSALVAPSLAMAEGSVEVMSWGGAYSQSQVDAYNQPFEAETGISVNMTDVDNPATPIKAQAQAGNVTADLASMGYSDATRLCDEGALKPIDPADLMPAEDGTPAADDFLEGGLSDCFVATDVYATIIAFDESKFTDNPPGSIADFFDIETYPGKRGVLKEPRFNMEMALMADGVPADEVYDVLSTPEGLDRAFAKLDTIKDHAVFWEAGAQPPQLLADGEVVMTQAYNGRIFNASVDEGQPFKIIWDGQIYEMEGWVLPEDGPNPENAMAYLKFSTSAESLARASMQISYGPPRKSSAALVGNYKDTDIPMSPNLPTSPENMGNALAFDNDFWVDHMSQLNERFAAWLAS
ncbi:ABC transporter substrate-binding protein [Paracoccus tegillarcae]|uniref:Spermidine/putrescine ABC transporter substrate-binding protein n=1 Tax=Paracoccus tegillarcae TaxID=1529068 RepID=A0A2K9F4T3_9RHOB|nr:ABC transporter substrate-binding protein [Paracoccus tegillarcae]AUH35412.1 spermidine/putrescine ABC transporter substrate-binding protein [Paracoccus tegillarcae]